MNYQDIFAMASPARPEPASLPSATAERADAIGRLREVLRRAEKSELVAEGPAIIPFGVPAIDTLLGGGIVCGALHEIAAPRETELAAATGFALALAAACRRTVLWTSDDLSCAENGTPYGPGLDESGLVPERLITVAAAKSRDVLWTMEEALRCSTVGAVIGEIRCSEHGIDPVATRRLSLAAAEHGALALLLRTRPGDEPCAAATRWTVGPAPSPPDHHGIGPPRLVVHLVRNRRGSTGSWILEWYRVEQRFILAAAHPQPLAAPAFDRARRPARVA